VTTSADVVRAGTEHELDLSRRAVVAFAAFDLVCATVVALLVWDLRLWESL
jgi:hypothetical protein